MDEYNLPVNVGGLLLKNPFFIASGPASKTVSQLKRIEETGWAAASIKLSIDPAPYINHKPRYGFFREYNALGFTAEKRLTFAEGLKLIEDAKTEGVAIPLFANISYAGTGSQAVAGWVNMAKRFEDTGADAIELNMCCPNMSFNVEVTSAGSGGQEGGDTQAGYQTGASLGQRPELIAEILSAVKQKVNIPVFVKLTPEGGHIAEAAKVLSDAGANAVCTTGNRLGMPPIDIDDYSKPPFELQKEISMSCYSGAWLKPLALRDTFEMRKHCGSGPVIMASGGVTKWQDAAEFILCGANAVGICTAVLLNGYDIVRPMIKSLKSWMKAKGYDSIDRFRGRLTPELKSASELTVYDGYAEIINGGCKTKCGLCQKICVNFAPKLSGRTESGAMRIDRDLCSGCGICAARCPKNNIRMVRS